MFVDPVRPGHWRGVITRSGVHLEIEGEFWEATGPGDLADGRTWVEAQIDEVADAVRGSLRRMAGLDPPPFAVDDVSPES